MRAFYPGSFDPPTNGHLAVVRTIAKAFTQVVVAVGYNPAKSGWIAPDDRVRLWEQIVEANPELSNVSVTKFNGMTVDAAKAAGANVLVKGVRDTSDFESEKTQATVNRQLSGLDTLLVPADPKWSSVSSSLVRELVFFGMPVAQYVPREVQKAITEREEP